MAQHDEYQIMRLVRGAKRGDNNSFSQLLKIIEPDLKKVAAHYFILGQDREDVLQELRIGVHKAVHSYDEDKDTTFRSFCVNLVCKRHLATAISTAKRNKHAALNDAVSLDAPIIMGEDGNMQTLAEFIPDRSNPFEDSCEANLLDDIISRQEYDDNANRLRERLTPLEESIFTEYTLNASYQEISEALQVTPKCVDNALMRIRKKGADVYNDPNYQCESPEDNDLPKK